METIAAFIRNNPIALVLLAIGLVLRFWVNRRRFYRRGVGGLQQFSSYGKAVLVLSFERFIKLVYILLFIAALFIFITGHK